MPVVSVRSCTPLPSPFPAAGHEAVPCSIDRLQRQSKALQTGYASKVARVSTMVPSLAIFLLIRRPKTSSYLLSTSKFIVRAISRTWKRCQDFGFPLTIFKPDTLYPFLPLNRFFALTRLFFHRLSPHLLASPDLSLYPLSLLFRRKVSFLPTFFPPSTTTLRSRTPRVRISSSRLDFLL